MQDIVFSYGWEPVPIHRIQMNTRNVYPSIFLCLILGYFLYIHSILKRLNKDLIVYVLVWLKIHQKQPYLCKLIDIYLFINQYILVNLSFIVSKQMFAL